MPRYATFCLRTVAASAPHLHLFLVYENATMILPECEGPSCCVGRVVVLTRLTSSVPLCRVQADNIHYVSIKEGEVAERLLTALKGVRVCPHANPSRPIGP